MNSLPHTGDPRCIICGNFMTLGGCAYCTAKISQPQTYSLIPVPLDDRRTFIREQAMRLRCIREDGSSVYLPTQAWHVAREMWDSKPEDC